MISLSETAQFLQRYQEFQSRLIEKRNVFVVERIGGLKERWEAFRASIRETIRGTAPDFNIFRLLSEERYEIAHSRMLEELLSPDGSHGQNSLFLDRFLSLLHSRAPDEIPSAVVAQPNDQWRVQREKDTGRFGRLDLVISNPAHRLLIVIENKIDAGDQDRQLLRYFQWLDEQRDYSYKTLIYLTPDGRESPDKWSSDSSGAEYMCLSYVRDIVGWLDECLSEVGAVNVRECLVQYRSTVAGLTGDSMDTNKELLDFLADKDNIEIVLEIAEHAEQVKDRLQTVFWMRLHEIIAHRLESENIVGWKSFLESMLSSGGGIEVKQKHLADTEKSHLFLSFVLKQEGARDARLWISLAWPDDLTTDVSDISEIRELNTATKAFGLSGNDARHPFGWKYPGGYVRSKESLKRIAVEPDQYVKEVADYFWKFFEDFRRGVELVNDQLAGKKYP